MGIGIEPVGDGVRAKCQYHSADGLIRICWRYRFDYWLDHSRFSLHRYLVYSTQSRLGRLSK